MTDEYGPIYGVELLDSLPLDGGGMRQALPSRSDLKGIQDYRQGTRVVAGYEVLLEHYRRLLAERAEVAKVLKLLSDCVAGEFWKFDRASSLYVCTLCYSESRGRETISHKPDCPVTAARELLARMT